MRFVFAALPAYADAASTLTNNNANDRLLSYYLLKELPDEMLHYYVETGLVLQKKDKKLKNTKWKHSKYIRERRIYLSQRNQEYRLNGE